MLTKNNNTLECTSILDRNNKFLAFVSLSAPPEMNCTTEIATLTLKCA